jgi:CBS domain containing-hemolysin-like protein
MVVFFAFKQFTANTQVGSFLSESTHFEEVAGETAPPTETEGGHHEEGGIELHYSFGTKGFWICVGVSLILTGIAGIMSGLTVGLLSIDTLELEMKLIHGTDEQKRLAASVLPLLHKHHYLLVTLLLCNAFAMEALPIFLDAIVPSAWAIIISVTAVLFFGEIIPQAVCTGPQQLKIAACVAPSVNFIMIAVGIIAYPISKILDWLLGEHHAIRYTNNALKALIELHSYAALQETIGENTISGFGLQSYQTKMIQGAIDIQASKIKDIMIPFDRMCSMRIGKKMDFKSAKKMCRLGYSRIPVYMRRDKHAIIGYMLIKSLVGVDLTQGKTISQLINDSEITLRKPLYVSPNEDTGPLLTRFKNGRSHMAIVTDNIKEMAANMKKYLDDDGSVIEEEDENDFKEN